MKRVKDVDEYIATAPKELQSKLRQLRAAIKETAPLAEERISYMMPYYGYNGRLVYFAYARKHIGVYIPPPIVEEYQKELKGYDAEGATIRFPLDQELPLGLIKKLIQARMKKNEDAKKKK